MRSRGLAEALAVLLAGFVLTTALTYPLVPGAAHLGRVNTDDGRLSIWNVAWVAHALLTDPAHLYDANIFYPAKHALAFSEANIAAGVLGLPAWALTGNPYLTHNVAAIVAFVASFAGMYYLARYLTGVPGAAAVSAVLFAFCPYIYARTAHIQLLMTGGLPFALLAFHALVDRPTARRAVTLGVVLWVQALACAYYGIFAALVVGLGTIYYTVTRRLWATPRVLGLVALAAVVSIALTVPFFLPYRAVQREGFARTIDDARMYSANGGAWLASSAWAHRWWLPAIQGFNEVLFPGVLAVTLGVAGAAIAWRRRPAGTDPAGWRLSRETAGFYVLVAALAFWASFGPDAGLYRVLFDTIPIFSFLRAPARLGLLVALSLSLLASVAVAALLARTRRPQLVAAGLVLAAAAELNAAPLRALREAEPVARAYRTLATLPRGPVAEFPYFYRRSDFPRHAYYMLNSTAHWQPLVNGYSDHIPAEWRRDVVPLSSFPTRESFDILGRIGARYVVFHLNLYDARSRERLLERLDTYGRYLRPLVQQDDVWLYEIVDWPN